MLSISCLSLISPLGHTPQSTAAALRSGIAAFDELGYLDRAGVKIMGAFVPAVPAETRGQARLKALARLIFEELDPDIGGTLPWDRMPVILCTREMQRPGGRLRGVAADLKLPDGSTFQPAGTSHIAGGPTSAFDAIGRARGMLADPEVPACLILAIDSLIDARVLIWLDEDDRLKTSLQTDGVIPGEAACLALVSREPMTPTWLTFKGLGVAQEPATVLNEEPLLGEGLTAALRAALDEARIGLHQVDFRMSDVAGESYAFKELVLAQTRLMRQVRTSQPVWHPADCIGDCGAAAGMVQFAWAEQAFVRGYAPGTVAALHGSSAFGARAAAIVGS